MTEVCHLHFVKSMLFYYYGVTVNSSMLPVAFAIIFGNENTSRWMQIWKYVLNLHPSIATYYAQVWMVLDADSILTPFGVDKYVSMYSEIHHSMYIISFSDNN